MKPLDKTRAGKKSETLVVADIGKSITSDSQGIMAEKGGIMVEESGIMVEERGKATEK